VHARDMKVGVALMSLASLVGCSACANEGAVDIERRHYERADHDGPIHVTVGGLTITLPPALHPRSALLGDGSTEMTWVGRVYVSEPIDSAESVPGSSTKLGRTANVVESGFEVVLDEDELGAALTGTPVRIKLTIDGGQGVLLSLDLDAALLGRRSQGPYVLGANLSPVAGPSSFFETTLEGPATSSVQVHAATAPTLTETHGSWRIGWGFDDLLTTAKWRNGAVRIDVTDPDAQAFAIEATLAPAIHHVDVMVAD